MTNLVVCCDGTWNTRNNMDGNTPAPTNVVKFHALLAATDKDGKAQERYYRPGVGTSGSKYARALGGAIGRDIDNDIKSAYKWLAEHYQAGDRVYFVGFSRGAYAARSLAGMIGTVGLLDLTDPAVPDENKWRAVEAALEAYQARKLKQESDTSLQSLENLKSDIGISGRAPDKVAIDFLGVWDTVGSLGIPDDLGLMNMLSGGAKKYRFHDTQLGKIVRTARHAVGIDERRGDFSPTMWTGIDSDERDVKQVWFAGVHGDIGGSYGDHDLGDVTLRWMMQEASTAGLEFRENAFDDLSDAPRGQLHDSVTGVFSHRRTRPRNVPDLSTTTPELSPAVAVRRLNPHMSEPYYWYTRHLDPGEHTSVDIYASDPWARTGVYFRAGERYELAAQGEWLDKSIKAGPDGAYRGKQVFKKAIAYGLFAGAAETARAVLRKLPNAENADNDWSRRVDAPWFALIGVIANGDGVGEKSQSKIDHETFLIGSHKILTVTKPGYLYCFANDVWAKYANNRGKLRLRIKRTS